MKSLIRALLIVVWPALLFSQDNSGHLPDGENSVAGHGAELLYPTLTGVDPNSVTIPASLVVAISGSETHFISGSNTSVWFNQGSWTIFPYYAYPVHDELVHAYFSFTNWDIPGIYTANTYNDIDGHLHLEDAFELLPDPYGPSLISITPDSAFIPENLTVTITGENTHFLQGSATVWLVNEYDLIYGQNVINLSDAKMEADFSFMYYHQPGLYNLVTYNYNDGYVVLHDAFTLYPNPNPPEITAIAPSYGRCGDSLTVAISGKDTHFTQGTLSISLFKNQNVLIPTEVTIMNDELITAEFHIPEGQNTGLYNLEYFNDFEGGYLLPDAFNVYPANPQILAMIPNKVIQGVETTMTVIGENTLFATGSNMMAWFSFEEFTLYPDALFLISDESFYMEFVFPFSYPTGYWMLNIYNDIDGHLPASDPLVVQASTEMPVLVSILPDSCMAGEQVTAIIRGENTGFDRTGITNDVWLEQDETVIEAEHVTVLGNDELEVVWTVPGDAITGSYNLFVSNMFDGTLSLPGIFHVSDTTGSVAGYHHAPVISVFPNPGSGVFHLIIQTDAPADLTVSLTDCTGVTRELLFRETTSGISETLHLAGYPPGIYLLQVVTGSGQRLSRKVIIAR